MIKKISPSFKREGLLGFFKLVIVRTAISFIALPLALSIFFISPWVKIRLIRLFSSRIGHYSLNTELLLCALDENLFEDKKKYKTLFYTSPGDPICNIQLHCMWKRYITILPFPLICNHVDRLLILLLGEKYHNDLLKITFETAKGARDRWRLLEKRKKCHITFTLDEENTGQKLLTKLGIPSEANYICLLVRDSKYLKFHMPHVDWSYHDYRDADINNYQEAAKLLADKGYYVVRMGKHVIDRFDVKHPNVIDYANSHLRSDFMDIYLTANCFFMISTSCGLDSIAHIFRKPLLITNLALTDLMSWNFWTLFIPKKVLNLKNGKFLTFKEIYREIFLLKDKKLLMQILQENEWRFIDNTSEEINESVEEMLQKMSNSWKESDDNLLLHERFWNSFKIELPEKTLSYKEIKLRMGEAFLRKNQNLLN